MANQTNRLNLVLTATDRDLQVALKRTQAALTRLAATTQKSSTAASASMARFSASVTASVNKAKAAIFSFKGMVIGLGGAAVTRSVVKLAGDFEYSLANINTLLGEGGVSIERFKDQLVELSQESSKDILDLSKGLYQVISAGIPAVEGAAGAFATLEAAQNAAVAGLSTTEEAVNAVVSVVNAYGAENLNASDASDKLLKIVQLGRTTFPELAAAIGRVTPIAAKFGVEFDDVGAMLIQLTRAGINTNEAVTGLRSVMKSLTQPTQQTRDVLAALNKDLDEGAKVSFTASALATNGLVGQLQKLTEATGGSADILGKLFPNIRAILPALIAVGKGSKQTAVFQQQLADSLGTTDAAVKKINPTFNSAAKIFQSQIQASFIQAGENVLPTLIDRMKQLGEVIAANQHRFEAVFTTIINVLDAFTRLALFLGGPVIKVLAAVFAGKAIRAFNALIMTSIGRMTAFGATATASMAKANAAFQFSRATGGSAMAAAGAWGSTFVGGIDKSLKGNAGAMKRIMGNLPSLLGIAMIGIQLGQMLGDFLGKALARHINGPVQDELRGQAQVMQQQLERTLAAKGFESMEQFNQAFGQIDEGKAIQMDADAIQEVELRLRMKLLGGGMSVDERLVEKIVGGDLASQTQEFRIALNAQGDPELDKMLAQMDSLGAEIEKQEQAAVQADRTRGLRARSIADGHRAAAEAAKQRRREMAMVILQEVADTETGERLKREFAEESNATIFTNFKDVRDQVKTFDQLYESERLERIKRGMDEETAKKQAQYVTLSAIESELAAAEVQRAELKQDLAEEEKSLQAFIAGMKERAAKNDGEYTKADQHALSIRYAQLGNIRTAINQINNGRIRELETSRAQLQMDQDLLAAAKERAEKAQADAKAAARRAAGRAAYQRRIAASAQLTRMLQGETKKLLDLDVDRLSNERDLVNVKRQENAAAQNNAKTDDERLKLLEDRKALAHELYTAESVLLEKQLEAAIEGEKLRQANREKSLLKTAKTARRVAEANKAITKEREQLEQKIEQMRIATEQKVRALTTRTLQEYENGAKQADAIRKKSDDDAAKRQREINKEILKGVKAALKARREAREKQAKATLESSPVVQEQITDVADMFFGGDTKQVTQELIDAMAAMNITDRNLGRTFALGELAAIRLKNAGKVLGQAALDLGGGAVDSLTAASQLLSLNFADMGKGFTSGILAAAKASTDVVKLGFVDSARLLGGPLSASLQNSGLFDTIPDAAEGASRGDQAANKMKQALQAGGQFAAKGLAHAFEAGTHGLALVFDSFVKLTEKALKSVIEPVLSAVSAPLDQAFGALGEAVSVLTSDQDDRDAEQAERVANMRQEHLARLATLRAQGASNEEIAAAQAAFASRVEDAGGEAQKSPADVLDEVLDKAIQMAIRVAENLPQLVQQFITGLIDAIPRIVPALFQALADAITVIAENFGPLLKSLINTIVDNLPIIIDALVKAIPLIVKGLIEGLTVLIERLPEIITVFIEGIVEMLPDLIDAIIEALPALVEAIVIAVPGIIIAITRAIPKLIAAVFKAIFVQIPRAIGAVVKGIVDGLKKFFNSIGGGAKAAFDSTAGRIITGIATLGISEGIRAIFHEGGIVSAGMRDTTTASAMRRMGVAGFQDGGMVNRASSRRMASAADNVPALLQAGEAVLNRGAVRRLGEDVVNGINSGTMALSGAQNLNVSLGINPNANGLSAAAGALLPMLIGSISAQVTNGAGQLVQALDGQAAQVIGFRSVPGRS